MRSFVALVVLALLGCQEDEVPALAVAPGAATLTTGQSLQLAVTRQFRGGPLEALTDRVTYVPSSGNVRVTSAGLVTATQPGNVVLRIVDGTTDAATSLPITVVPP